MKLDLILCSSELNYKQNDALKIEKEWMQQYPLTNTKLDYLAKL